MAVSGLYRNTRQDDFFWFAFRRPEDWVQLDAATRSNGAIYVAIDGLRWGFLLVEGAVALKGRQRGPGYRRLHAMVVHGMRWAGPPTASEPIVWEGRDALRSQWADDQMGAEAVIDLASGVVV
ncbi:MAG: hypothetical protein ACRDYV_00275, partial [Acidimicrobiia bacterium]